MRKSILLLFSTCIGLHAEAQTLKVVKVVGKRAIVETVNGYISKGQTLNVGGGSSSSSGSGGSGGSGNTGPRDHFVGGSASFGSAKSGTTTLTTISATALYGWNPGNNMEYGAIAS